MVVVREGVIGDLADYAAADGRSFAAGACACLGLHLSVAGDDDVIGIAGRRIRVYLRPRTRAAADACAVFAALGGEGAFGVVVVLDGQLAGDGFAIFRPFIVLLKARIVAAALQLVGAVQLDGGIVVTLHGDGGFARIDWAVTAVIHLGLAADVNFQVVEGDVHVALGGVDGDGVLIRLAGDDGLPLILLEILFTLLDIVIVSAFIARTFDRNVAVGDVPCFRIGRDAGAHHDARDDGGGHAPPECALQSHRTSPFVLCIMQCRRCGSEALL